MAADTDTSTTDGGAPRAPRSAVVTGGASGIGRATVLRLLDEAGAAARLRFVPTDVTDEDAVAALAGWTVG